MTKYSEISGFKMVEDGEQIVVWDRCLFFFFLEYTHKAETSKDCSNTEEQMCIKVIFGQHYTQCPTLSTNKDMSVSAFTGY